MNKKYYFLILGFFLTSLHLFARTASVSGDTILPKPKIDLQQFLANHVRYPDLAAEKV